MVLSSKARQRDLSGWGSAKPGAVSPPPAGHSRRGKADHEGRSGQEGCSEAAGRGKAVHTPARSRTGLAAEALTPGRQAGSSAHFAKWPETPARPLGSRRHRDALVHTARDPADPLPLQALQRRRQPPGRNPAGRGPLRTARADPGKFGRREGVREAVSLDLGGVATGRTQHPAHT
ncbi:hypothetical protein NN561_012403 [Cricetulus griseus]